MKSLLNRFLQGKLGRSKQSTDALQTPKNMNTSGLFGEATSFADDTYALQVAQIAGYKLATFILLGLCFVLGLAISVMMPLSKTDLVVVHSAQNGLVWVEPPKNLQAKVSTAQTESELANYVTNRESYSAFTYAYQFRLVNLMSDAAVSKAYLSAQDASDSSSPVAVLGNSGTKRVTIESVIFLDSEDANKDKARSEKQHQNLAQVNFVVTTTMDGQSIQTPYVALLSWTYLGTPDDPSAKWQDWDGFTVTEYSVSGRVVDVTK